VAVNWEGTPVAGSEKMARLAALAWTAEAAVPTYS
jgi:hypothetical protein